MGTDKTAEGKSLEMDVYSLIRSAEIRDYYRRKNVCDNWKKKVLLIQHSFISVQKKAAMIGLLSGTGTLESELDGNGCWYHFFYFGEKQEFSTLQNSLDLTWAEINLTSGYSSLDWIERA